MLFHEVNETLLGHEYDDRLSREKKNFVTSNDQKYCEV